MAKTLKIDLSNSYCPNKHTQSYTCTYDKMATNKVIKKNDTYYSNQVVWFWNGPFSNWYRRHSYECLGTDVRM